MVEWTRWAGHLLLLVPPFATTPCERPVLWRAERIESAPRGGEGVAKVLATEVAYRLTGNLQTPSVAGATWSDLSVCVGAYRLHPAAGLFAVTCLPLWSLAVLDNSQEAEAWLASLVDLAGNVRSAQAPEAAALQPDHYGFLVFLLRQSLRQRGPDVCRASVFTDLPLFRRARSFALSGIASSRPRRRRGAYPAGTRSRHAESIRSLRQYIREVPR
jgi:hypothetical protein